MKSYFLLCIGHLVSSPFMIIYDSTSVYCYINGSIIFTSATFFTAKLDFVPVLSPTFTPDHWSPTAQTNLAREAFRFEKLGRCLGLPCLSKMSGQWHQTGDQRNIRVAMTQFQASCQQDSPPQSSHSPKKSTVYKVSN